MRIHWKVGMLLALGAVLAGMPMVIAPASAEDAVTCMMCQLNLIYEEGTWSAVHSFPDSESCWAGNDCSACGLTSSCHTEPQAGICHERCPWQGAFVDEKEQVEKLLAQHDASRLLALIKSSSMTTYNTDRSSLQMRSPCNPEVIALNIPVPEAVSEVLEAAL